MKVSAVVVHWRSVNTVLDTIDDLLKQTVHLQQLVVVDHSEDRELDLKLGPLLARRLRVIRAANRGYGAGMNLGVHTLNDDPDFLLLCTHEVRLEKHVVGTLTAAVQPEDGLVAPLLGRSSRPNTVWSVGGILKGSSSRPTHIGRGDNFVSWRYRRPFMVEWADGALLLVRRSAFLSIGGFLEYYFMYHEDVELCLKLRTNGWTIRVVPSALAWQEPSGVPPYLDARNHLKTVLKYRRRSIFAAVMYHGLRAAGDFLAGETRFASARVAGMADAACRNDSLRKRLVNVRYPY